MGTQLAVRTEGARGVMSINLANVNYGAAKGAIDKYISSVGGSSGGKKNFPGDQISFKSGEWYRGFGDKARTLKNGTEFVFNVPNMMASWLKWSESESGKKFPKYTEMTFPAAGDDPIERNTLGDDDDSEWELNDQGQPQDPWKPVLVFPIRGEDDAVIHHVLFTTKSSVIAGFNLFRDILDEMKLHDGELPTVKLGASKTSREFEHTDKKGKKKKVKQTWDVPTMEVTGWVDAIAEDNPAKGGVPVTADANEPADLGKVEVKSRVAPKGKKPLAISKPAAAPAKKGTKSRRVVEVEDDETL